MSGVLVDGTPLDTEHRFRGIGSYVRGLLTGFEEIGCDFPTLRQVRRNALPGKAVGTPPNSATVVRPVRPQLRLDWLWNELWLRKEVGSVSASLYHATDPAGIPISRRFKTIATVYDLIPLAFSEHLRGLSPDRRLGYRAGLRRLRQADHLISISEFTRQDVSSRLGIDPERITTVPLAVDFGAFMKPEEKMAISAQERHQLPEKYILYVGSLETHKRVPLAIEAAAQSGVPLVIVGRHSTGQQQQLAEVVERLHAGPYVYYLGYISGEDLTVLYRDARAFVFPSVYEGFGLPVLEAMAARCPVVTTSAASLPEVAGDAALVVPPEDLHPLAQAICSIAEDDGLRGKLIEAGFSRARRFTWEETARSTVKVYERVLEGNT